MHHPRLVGDVVEGDRHGRQQRDPYRGLQKSVQAMPTEERPQAVRIQQQAAAQDGDQPQQPRPGEALAKQRPGDDRDQARSQPSRQRVDLRQVPRLVPLSHQQTVQRLHEPSQQGNVKWPEAHPVPDHPYQRPQPDYGTDRHHQEHERHLVPRLLGQEVPGDV